jgi:Holliday junction resolvase RusA-like endonuclease
MTEDISISFVVQGEAVPKQSFRFAAGGRSFQKPRVTAWEEVVRLSGMAARPKPSKEQMAGGWSVALTFYRKSRRAVDIDNLSKAVLDALQGVLWDNDRLVVELHVGKVPVDRDPMVKIEAWPYEEVR